jgi:hypothetical protein
MGYSIDRITLRRQSRRTIACTGVAVASVFETYINSRHPVMRDVSRTGVTFGRD